MDFLNNLTGGNKQHGTAGEAQTVARPQDTTTTEHKESGGFLSGLSSKMNEAAGGGRKSEANEDYLDKGVDWVQEHVLGEGPQDNESALEQAKDEQISDFIRSQYKTATGKDFPIADKS